MAATTERLVINNRRNRFGKWKDHAELLAALVSGVLIVVGWLLESYGLAAAAIPVYCGAFMIGGYAKAREGMEETFKHKQLNVEMLMVFAAVGAAIIGYWAEGAILIFIFALSGALETYTMDKSHKEISALMKLQPEEAVLLESGQETIVPAAKLRIGDSILIRPGERVPADGNIIEGMTALNEAAITGEAIPVTKAVGQEVFAGTLNVQGSVVVMITKPMEETMVQKIIRMVQTAKEEKSPSQLFIERFEGLYVKVVLIAVALVALLPPLLFDWTWLNAWYRAMILLVVASPCALVASIMPAVLSAISANAKRGILFKGGVHVEHAGKIKAIAFDKTGTLTKGKPEVCDFILREGANKDDVLLHAVSIEHHSTHPLAEAIVAYAKEKGSTRLLNPIQVQDTPGVGVKGRFDDGEWRVGQAAFVGEQEAEHFQNGVAKKLAAEGKTVVFIQDTNGIVGVLALRDEIRPETLAAMKALQKQGIQLVMLTGDGEETAQAIAEQSGVDRYVSRCMPDKKAEEIKRIRQEIGTVAMVGDGINDAPALAAADLGVAMGGGSDVALETADMVLMKNELPNIADAIKRSKKMNRIVKQNIVFSIAVVLLLVLSNFMQVLDLPLGVIGHEGSTILVILNGLRLLNG
ncbi:heavy metal translocating P-type ATPase [Shouchella rhizosphaerae]|uniref:Heavy metal translocating P-type ATPase n=1 Tax=Shouchella rhizosphaerae TaxID=866786 RepID=A0ABZ2CW01_9BACI